VDAVRNLEVTFRSIGGGSKEKMQEDWESIRQRITSKHTVNANELGSCALRGRCLFGIYTIRVEDDWCLITVFKILKFG